MTYNNYIKNILNTRGRFGIPKEEYKERHHIIPICCGGLDDDDNLIDLYAKEHYIAHKLLFEENPENLKLASAFIRMAHRDNIMLTPEEYEYIRKIQSQTQSKLMSGRAFYTDGEKTVLTKDCPDGFYKKDVSKISKKNGSRGYKLLEEVLEELDIKEFIDYCSTHTFIEILNKFKLTKKMTKKVMRYLHIKRGRGLLNKNRAIDKIKNIDYQKFAADWYNGDSDSELALKYNISKTAAYKLRKELGLLGVRDDKKRKGTTHPRARKLYCVELNKIYSSIYEASEDTGINYSTLKAGYKKGTKIKGLTFIPLYERYM